MPSVQSPEHAPGDDVRLAYTSPIKTSVLLTKKRLPLPAVKHEIKKVSLAVQAVIFGVRKALSQEIPASSGASVASCDELEYPLCGR
jgi:hypothetical protein